MTVALELEAVETLSPVLYRWDADTGILSADLYAPALTDAARGSLDRDDGPGGRAALAAWTTGAGGSGSVAVEGEDGSWLTLDLVGGCVQGVQVAIWPRLRRRRVLDVPRGAAARARLRSGDSAGEVLSVEVSAPLVAEVDGEGRCFHFVMGGCRAAAVFAIASDVLLELDASQRLSGLWLLDVPPPPEAWTVP